MIAVKCMRLNSEWRCHVAGAEIARKSYQTDCEDEWPSDTSVGSVDLQKIISLPQIPAVKSNLVYQNNYCFSHTRSLQLARKKKRKAKKYCSGMT